MNTATETPTLTPEEAWRRRVREAKEWVDEKLSEDHDAGERLLLAVLLTHIETLEWLVERRTEERDGLLGALRSVVPHMEHVDETTAYGYTGLQDVLSEARDAIAKVEGE